ncbi:MAG: hypothetical protein D6691_08445 [Candidatus Hydrogenedentota bacterium]|nr:MAG: hypothetical protein D6691_08445 [Candidatus Hydrogenedentota bacterium]
MDFAVALVLVARGVGDFVAFGDAVAVGVARGVIAIVFAGVGVGAAVGDRVGVGVSNTGVGEDAGVADETSGVPRADSCVCMAVCVGEGVTDATGDGVGVGDAVGEDCAPPGGAGRFIASTTSLVITAFRLVPFGSMTNCRFLCLRSGARNVQAASIANKRPCNRSEYLK